MATASKKHKALSKNAKGVVEREFANFFETFCTGTASWPGLTDQQLCDGLADSLAELARRRGIEGTALIQTLVYELQDRINQKLN